MIAANLKCSPQQLLANGDVAFFGSKGAPCGKSGCELILQRPSCSLIGSISSQKLKPSLAGFLLPESEPQQLTEHQSLGAADSGLSDATQAPNWLQRWAALFMPGESDEQSQASMQQWMSSITAAMHQAQQEVPPGSMPPSGTTLSATCHWPCSSSCI